MVEITHKLRFVAEEGDPLGVTEGWDLNIHTGAVHFVDPKQPDLYEQDSQHIMPASVLLVLALASEDTTVEEV